VLIRGTIAENIAWGRADPASEEVRVAAGRATAAEFISRLPDRYETMLGEDGAGLSGGERQRIAIARALVGSPKLLLLDEPSNHLDQASIDVVLSGLAVLPGNPTVVMVTHDIQVAARADRMVTLRDGRLVEDVRVGPSAPL
jgi:ABC-type bacteriocin/lantibiotic exporter with double-glycine peptidase domain